MKFGGVVRLPGRRRGAREWIGEFCQRRGLHGSCSEEGVSTQGSGQRQVLIRRPMKPVTTAKEQEIAEKISCTCDQMAELV
jgi:hypothetical protein